MNTPTALATAICFLWLGMVFAISFVEAPLKFRAPGVTLPIGLGIGRMVFRVLNSIEAVGAAALLIAVIVGNWDGATVTVTAGVAIGVLVVQLAAVRPALTRRSDHVLAGHEGPRSHAHLVYVALELIKVGALVWLGTVLLI